MFTSGIQFHGLPPRGSIQDRISCEMLLRARRRKVSEQAYLGRLLAVSMGLPDAHYRLLTELLAFEVFHENYSPATLQTKKQVLHSIKAEEVAKVRDRERMFKALQKLNVSDKDLRPATPEELEMAKRRLRKARLRRATEK